MKISPTMPLDHLAERMWVNGDEPDLALAQRMRDLLVSNATAYQWESTNDVEDVDWFRMLDEAVS